MNQGDVYLCDLEPIAGREQNGRRPVLVVSATEFNRRTGTPVILPITTGGDFAKRRGFAYEIPAGFKTIGVIRCDQPRAVDMAARKGRFLEALDAETVSEVLERLYSIFEE